MKRWIGRNLTWIVPLMIFLIAGTVLAWEVWFIKDAPDHEAEARQLYIGAYKLLTDAADAGLVQERLALLRLTLKAMDDILDKYPDTNIAADIASGQMRIGSWTLYDFRTRIIPDTELIASVDTEVYAGIGIFPTPAERQANETR